MGHFFKEKYLLSKLKPALTYSEQITRLQDIHNLIINDETNAINILKRVSYYRLSGYGIGLKNKNNSEKYIDGISIESLYKLYNFDSKFKNLLMHTIEQIEIQLRAQISNYLALKYGPEGYIDNTNFFDKLSKNGESIHSIIIDNFKNECTRQKNVPFVKHHMNKYNGHFPIWVAVELFTFGNLCSLYSIMKKEDQKEISYLYNTSPTHLTSWILSLVEVRNICAHYTRLYNLPLKQTPYLYKENKIYKSTKTNKIFPVIITLKRMLIGNKPLWIDFSCDLTKLINENADVINLSFMGFPKDWKEILRDGFTDSL